MAAEADLVARALHARVEGIKARAEHLEKQEEPRPPQPVTRSQVLRLLESEFAQLAAAISTRAGQESDLS